MFVGPSCYGKSQPRNLGIPCGAQKYTREKRYNAWKTEFWATYESISRGQVLSGLAACFKSNAINFESTICTSSIIDHWKGYWALAPGTRGHNSASMDLYIHDVHFHFKKWNNFVGFFLGAARQNPVVAAAIEIEGRALPGSRSCEAVPSGPFCVKKMKRS